MKFLQTPKSTYLLQASLDVLHFESHEWQNEMAFMSDETNFLHKLHLKFMEKILPEKQRTHSTELQVKLTQFSTLLNNIKDDIQAHERYLANILQNNINVSDEEYRARHQAVKQQAEYLFNEFKQLKKEFFYWAEDVIS
ncbi:hypothetical protein [Catalinimonas niigatensis]|uniref:hypothetical protein n=1 Tax=Catalinimonas niigatensis TaxID=1397264 RepID=UPI00266582CB|nr:hypothetical protein [Catalinimonas niigatensis]WPP49802.1 hypothetical protein PZB72_24325 [Catalinimonas niigatensis]